MVIKSFCFSSKTIALCLGTIITAASFSVSAQRAFIDPNTGELTSQPSAADIEASQSVQSTAAPEYKQVVLPDGAVMLHGPFLVDVTARVDEKGQVHIQHQAHQSQDHQTK